MKKALLYAFLVSTVIPCFGGRDGALRTATQAELVVAVGEWAVEHNRRVAANRFAAENQEVAQPHEGPFVCLTLSGIMICIIWCAYKAAGKVIEAVGI